MNAPSPSPRPTAARRGRAAVLCTLAAASVLLLVLCPLVGQYDVWEARQAEVARWVLWELRIPRVLFAFLVGSGLALAGVAFQALFRNPLAEPYTLGVSSGAALGAAGFLLLSGPLARWSPFFQHVQGMGWGFFGGRMLFAFLGAAGVVLLVYGLTRLRGGFSASTLLLAGVAVSFFCSSLILAAQYLSDYHQVFDLLRWMMGSLERANWTAVWGTLPFVAAAGVLVAGLHRELNLLSAGEDLALSRGVDAPRVQKAVFLAASLLVGVLVAVAGPVGFVGLMAPHICRLLVGADHKFLGPCVCLFGGLFLLVCDTLARTAASVLSGGQMDLEIPVGIITALLGGPFFLGLLFRSASERSLLR